MLNEDHPDNSRPESRAAATLDIAMDMPTSFPEWNNGSGVASRRVSFPNDKHLVTGYMEPADPWANGESGYEISQLMERLYSMMIIR